MSQNVLVLVNIIFFHAWGSNWATTLTSALPSTVVDSCQPSTTNKKSGAALSLGLYQLPVPKGAIIVAETNPRYAHTEVEAKAPP